MAAQADGIFYKKSFIRASLGNWRRHSFFGPMPIRNIVFDLGGVFINIDYGRTRHAFGQLGVADFDALYAQHSASPLFEQLETGAISNQEFYDAFRTSTGLGLSNQEIEQAWNAMLGGFPPERIAWLSEIKNRYRIYLFSNTNAIHHQAFQQIFRETNPDGPQFDDYFIKAHYSHTLGLRKPYASSYTALMHAEQMLPEETLFIDDTFINIKGAEEAGMHTIWLQPPQTVLDLAL